MKEQQNLDTILTSKVSTVVFKNALPAMAAMLMVLIYNLADIFFIAQTKNDLMVAAVSLATPVFLIFMALGNLFGIGGTSVISRAMGEGRQDYAKKVCSFCMWGCIGVGIAVSALFWLFMDELLVMLGTSADTVEYTRTYLNIVTIAGTFSMISNCYANIIRAEGKATIAMMGTVIGNLLNVVLDPIMITTLNWGIAGAAIATVIGNVAGALHYFVYYWTGKSSLSIHIRDFSMKEGIVANVFAIGIPAAIANLLMSISSILVNAEMASYGDMALAAYGVSAKVIMIVAALTVGLGQGIQPLLGYCFGAKNRKRFGEILKFSSVFSVVFCIVLVGLVYVFVEPIVNIFLTDGTALESGIRFTQIMLTGSLLLGIIAVLTNALQAIGAAGASLIGVLCRQGFVFIPAMYLLNALIGVNGLVLAQPVADVISLIVVSVLLTKELRKLKS